MKTRLKLSYANYAVLLAWTLIASPAFSSEESDWLKSISNSSYSAAAANKSSATADSTAAESAATDSTAPAADSTTDESTAGGSTKESRSRNNMVVPTALLTKGSNNSRQLRAHADLYIKRGNIDESLKLLEQAMEINPSDSDTRLAYAIALEKKVLGQSPKDPHTYNLCIKQWLYLYKSAEFLEDNQMAANHLKGLCGEAPKRLQTAKAYLASVMLPDETETQNSEPIQVP